jgi:hypothetical protein
MWQWWFFTCVHNCAWIFLFVRETQKMKNGLLKSIKHVFSHYYFLHMWHASKSSNFELSEYKKGTKLFNKGIISIVVICFKNFKTLKFSCDFIFHQINIMNM